MATKFNRNNAKDMSTEDLYDTGFFHAKVRNKPLYPDNPAYMEGWHDCKASIGQDGKPEQVEFDAPAEWLDADEERV